MSRELCSSTIKIFLFPKKERDKVRDMTVGAEEYVSPQEFFLPCERFKGHEENHMTYYQGKELVFP